MKGGQPHLFSEANLGSLAWPGGAEVLPAGTESEIVPGVLSSN